MKWNTRIPLSENRLCKSISNLYLGFQVTATFLSAERWNYYREDLVLDSEMHHMLLTERVFLQENLRIERGLVMDCIIQSDVLSSRHLEAIKEQKGNSAKVTELLNILARRTIPEFDKIICN